MSIKLKKSLYISLITLTITSIGSPIISANAKSSANNASSQTQVNKTNKSSVKNNKSTKANSHHQKKSVTTNKGATKVTVTSTKKLPKQTYNKILTGSNQIYTAPGVLNNAKSLTTKNDINQLIKQGATFMAYQVAKTSNGSTYYKVVSLHHSIRGWIYSKGISNQKKKSITNKSKKSSNKKNNAKNNAKQEQKQISDIESLISQAQDSANQAQDKANDGDATSANQLMSTANQQLTSAQTEANKLTVASDKDNVSLKISDAQSQIQKIQDSIQDTLNNSDNSALANATNLVADAYSSLGSAKSILKNKQLVDYQKLEIINKVMIAQNDFKNAQTAANKINDSNTRNSALSNINSASDYMNTLITDNLTKAGITVPTDTDSDSNNYYLVTQYVDKANGYINANKSITPNDSKYSDNLMSSKTALQIAQTISESIVDQSIQNNASKVIASGISNLQQENTNSQKQ